MIRSLFLHSSWIVAACSIALLGIATASCAAEDGDSPTTGKAKTETSKEEGEDVAIAAIDEFITTQNIDKSASTWQTALSQPPQVKFDPDTTYYWNLKTNVGDITIKLLPDVAPMHVSSTI